MEADGKTLGGDPVNRVDDWHPQGWNDQGYKGTCGLVAVEGTARHADVDTTENDVVHLAQDHNRCEQQGDAYERGATSPEDRAVLLQEIGVPNEIESNATPAKLADMVEQGDGVIARVNAGELWDSDDPEYVGNIDADGRLRPNHAVAVTGTVRDEAGSLEGFVVNDSGDPDNGAGRVVPMDRWNAAWTELGGDRELNVVRASERQDR